MAAALRPGRARRALVAVAGLVLVTLSLAGCGGVVGSVVSTQTAITNAGYSSVKVGLTDGYTNLSVTAKSGSPSTAADTREVAGIVWHGFHLRFNNLDVKVDGPGSSRQRSYTFAQLQQSFGPRNPSYNKTSLHQSLEHFGIVIIIVIAVVVVLVVLLIVLVMRRRRRRRRALQSQWGQGQAYGPGQGFGPAQGYGSGQGYGPGQGFGLAQGDGPVRGHEPAQGHGPVQGHESPPRGYRPWEREAPVQPQDEGQSRPGGRRPEPAETDPWGRPLQPAGSGWDESGHGWGPPPRSGWGQPGEGQAHPGAPPATSGWGDDEPNPRP